MTRGLAASLPGLVSGPVAVRVPATSANLGPGFDSFGLALSLHDSVEATATPRGLDIEVIGEGTGVVPLGEEHLVVRALRSTLDQLGVRQPGLRLRCRNSIPHGRGLGSSAAAIVAGIKLAEALALDSGLAPGQDLVLATSLEGHADNVAACLRGGFTVAWTEPAGGGEAVSARAVRLDVHPEVRPVVFVPPATLSTEVARALLPAEISHADASRGAGRAGLLVAALTRYPQHLLAATEDRLHQEYRRSVLTSTLELIDGLRGAGIAAVVSGAGPAVLAFATTGSPVQASRWTPPRWRALVLSIDVAGAVTGIPRHGPELEQVHDSGRR